MNLSRYKVAAGVAVSNMDRAREFYEGQLGHLVGIDSGEDLQSQSAEGTVFHAYLSPLRTANLKISFPPRPSLNDSQRAKPSE